MSSSYALLLARHPRPDARVENVQRNRASAQYFIVKLPHIECVAKLALSVIAQLANFQLSDLVGERLTGPRDVPVNLDGDVVQRLAAVGREIVDGLLPAPSHRVQPRVEHQSHGPPHVVRQRTKSRVRIRVQAQIVAKGFGVKSPPFDERGEAQMLPELRNVLELLRERNLQVMPGNRLVDRERFHLPLRACLQIVCVRVEVTWAPRLRRSLNVIGSRHVSLRVGRHGDYTVRRARQPTKQADESGIDALRNVAILAQQAGGIGEEEPWIGAQELNEIREAAGESSLRDDAVHRGTNSRDLAETKRMDFARRHRGRRVLSDG